MAFRASAGGHISVIPALNAAEFDYLTAFVLSRRHAARSGPYDVPLNPAAEASGESDRGPDDLRGYNSPAPAQPALWCPWRPGCAGRCLTLDDREKVSAPIQWLQYLVDHFLAVGAGSSTSGLPDFAEFTYDHRLGRSVALHDSESGELSLIRAHGSTLVNEVVDGPLVEL